MFELWNMIFWKSSSDEIKSLKYNASLAGSQTNGKFEEIWVLSFNGLVKLKFEGSGKLLSTTIVFSKISKQPLVELAISLTT